MSVRFQVFDEYHIYRVPKVEKVTNKKKYRNVDMYEDNPWRFYEFVALRFYLYVSIFVYKKTSIRMTKVLVSKFGNVLK